VHTSCSKSEENMLQRYDQKPIFDMVAVLHFAFKIFFNFIIAIDFSLVS